VDRLFCREKHLKLGTLFSLTLCTRALTSLSFAQTRLTNASTKGMQNLDQGFVENKGQWDSRVQFLLHKPGMDIWLTKDGAVFDLKKLTPSCGKGKAKVQRDVVKMSFVGAQSSLDHGLKEEKGYFNYFIGNDRKKWASHVRRFSEVRTNEIYKGIAVRYYMENGSPRYDLRSLPTRSIVISGLRGRRPRLG
jgi:hypothetical protein